MVKKNVGGFTLIELVIVVAIVAILAAIALPSYTRYMYRSRRPDGQDFLLRVAAAEEAYKMGNNNYTTVLSNLGFSTNMSEHSYYEITVDTATGTTFSAHAEPQGVQAADQCGNLIITQSQKNSQYPPTNGACW